MTMHSNLSIFAGKQVSLQ